MKKIYLLLGLLLIAEWSIAQVKSEIKISTSKEYGDSFEMWPKSTSKEDTIFIDWGDGEIKKYNIDPEGMPYYTKVSGRIVGDTIRIFTKLVDLDCASGNVTFIQLINQPLLTKLIVNDNEISTDNCILDGALNMEIVDLSKNQLTILDMRPYEKLKYFSANDNENLSTVLFKDGSPALQSIAMSNCDISHFYPVSLSALSSLSLAGGSLMELEIGEFYPNLSSLDISENYISELDVTLCKQLTALNCDGNQLEKINVTQNPELLNLFCGNNRIKELNLSSNPKITNLGCSNNLLNTLDVSRLPNLTSLTCGQNYLKRLDLSQNAFLSKLYCNDNLLEFLDFAGNPRLDYVDCRNNAKMTACSLNYMFSTMLARYREPWGANLLIEGCNGEGADTEEINSEEMKWKTDIQGDGSAVCDSVIITLIPAENGTYHLEQPHMYGTDYREISTKAMVGTPVKVIATPEPDYTYGGVTVADEMIADTFFVLKDASTISVNFKSTLVPYITVNVAENTEMSFALQAPVENTQVTVDWGDGVEQTYTIETGWKRIDGYSNGKIVKITGLVTAANFESYPGMGIWDNQLTGIDVSHNNNLLYLSTYMNPIETLIVKNCLDLEYLDCSYCELSELDITANTKLTTLKCYGNKLAKLDITGCTDLETLNAKNNNLSELNLSANTRLVALDVQNNQLQQIDVAGMPKLQEFAANGNKLTEIDITNNPELAIFSVSANELTTLNLGNNKNLGKLQCANNKLASLDLSNQPELYYLDCGGNGMTACALNDLYYSLPEYPQLDEPLKGYTLWVRGDDGTDFNDASHAESIIAVGKGWLVNYEGDGSGCNQAYVTIKPSENGTIHLFDEAEKEIISGEKAEKNSIITIKAEPEQGYDVVSIKANGQEIENGRFTITRATDVVAKFDIAINIDAPEKSFISISGEKNEIKYNISVPAEVAIYTLTGIQIYKETISGNGHISLPAGSYLVTVHTEHANTSKVIIVG